MGKFNSLVIAVVMLVTGSYLLLLDPAVPNKPPLAAVSEAAKPTAPPPKLVNKALELKLTATAFASALILPTGEVQILAEQAADQPRPLASISKLFTAMVVLDQGGLDDVVTVTPEDLTGVIDAAVFTSGQTFHRRDLLYSLLLESNNTAAKILANQLGAEEFVAAMNVKAGELGLRRTHFLSPNGLDLAPDRASNYSTIEDLIQTAALITTNYPEIWEMTLLTEYPLAEAGGKFHHQVKSTNKLLNESHPWPATLVGGKTGQTELAKKNLLIVFRDQKTGGQLINVVLGSTDHFADMIKLTDWVYQSYQF